MAKNNPIKSICFFCSYYSGSSLPIYVRYYLTELTRHFTEVVLLTNEKTILPADTDFLQSLNIPYRLYENEGFDFGMWHKALREYDIEQYDRVGLINDSCILFKKLDFFFEWLESENVDYAGMTDCNAIQYHIQSYFLIINKTTIAPVKEYIERNGVVTNIKEVIKVYEVGLSQYLIGLGLKLTAYYPIQCIQLPLKNSSEGNRKLKDKLILSHQKWKLSMGFIGKKYMGNPMWYTSKELIKQGIPLIKKKILTRLYDDASLGYMMRFGFEPDPRYYIRLINRMYPQGNIKELTSGILVNQGLKKEIEFYSYIYMVEFYFFMLHKVYLVKRTIVLMLGRD